MTYDVSCCMCVHNRRVIIPSLSLVSHESPYLIANGWFSISLAATRYNYIKRIHEAIMLNDRSGMHVYICPHQSIMLILKDVFILLSVCLWIVAKVPSSCFQNLPITFQSDLHTAPFQQPVPGRSSLMASNDCLLRLRQRQSNDHVEELWVFDFSWWLAQCCAHVLVSYISESLLDGEPI